MKAVKIEVISLSESENEAEERYLKIYYPDSTNFIEVPLDDADGKLLLIDVKVMEPNIFALNLTSEKRGKLYKPKNGCFKEPKEKWSNFKVVAVLQPPVDANYSKSPISDSSSNINQLLPNAVSPENETIRKKKKVQHFIEDLPSPSIEVSIPLTNDPESTNSNVSVPSCDNKDCEIFEAYNVSSLNELKELLCDGNQIFYETFEVNMRLLRKTILSNPNVHIIKALFYAFQSNIIINTLDPTVSEYCQMCNKPFTIRHLVLKWHILQYQSIFNTDPPEMSIILNPDNFVHFMPTSALQKINPEKELYDFFTNVWFDKNIFDSFKGYIMHRVTKAKLNLSFKDSMLIEKLIFMRDASIQHPHLKEIFPMKLFCISCNKSFNSLIDFFRHILSKKHMLSHLTQEELNKLVYAVSFINYSDIDGYYYNSVISTEKRKRSHPKEIALETPSKRHIIFSDS